MRLAFEGLLVLVLFGVTLFLVGAPIIKLLRLAFPKKTDPLEEAKIRFEIAKKDAEAAELNKQTEKVYSKLYDDVLRDDYDEKKFEEKYEQK